MKANFEKYATWISNDNLFLAFETLIWLDVSARILTVSHTYNNLAKIKYLKRGKHNITKMKWRRWGRETLLGHIVLHSYSYICLGRYPTKPAQPWIEHQSAKVPRPCGVVVYLSRVAKYHSIQAVAASSFHFRQLNQQIVKDVRSPDQLLAPFPHAPSHSLFGAALGPSM